MTEGQVTISRDHYDALIRDHQRLTALDAAAPAGISSNDLVASIRTAESMLSAHIEEFHDFDYQPHDVPPELQQLRGLQHHLLGSLIDDKGENYPYRSDANSTIPHGCRRAGGFVDSSCTASCDCHVTERLQRRCEGCPPDGYPTDKTRCTPCDRRAGGSAVTSNERKG